MRIARDVGMSAGACCVRRVMFLLMRMSREARSLSTNLYLDFSFRNSRRWNLDRMSISLWRSFRHSMKGSGISGEVIFGNEAVVVL